MGAIVARDATATCATIRLAGQWDFVPLPTSPLGTGWLRLKAGCRCRSCHSRCAAVRSLALAGRRVVMALTLWFKRCWGWRVRSVIFWILPFRFRRGVFVWYAAGGRLVVLVSCRTKAGRGLRGALAQGGQEGAAERDAEFRKGVSEEGLFFAWTQLFLPCKAYNYRGLRKKGLPLWRANVNVYVAARVRVPKPQWRYPHA